MCVGGRGGWRTGWSLDSSEVCPHPGWFGVHCNREENRHNRFIKRLGEMWEIWSALCSYLCSLCWDRSEGKAWIHQEGASPLQGGTGTWIQSHLLNVGWEKSIRTINVLRGDTYITVGSMKSHPGCAGVHSWGSTGAGEAAVEGEECGWTARWRGNVQEELGEEPAGLHLLPWATAAEESEGCQT